MIYYNHNKCMIQKIQSFNLFEIRIPNEKKSGGAFPPDFFLHISIFYNPSAISYSRRSESSHPRHGSVMDFP